MAKILSTDTPLTQLGDQLKTPPHALEAEQSVLGGLLIDNASWDHIAEILSEADFFKHAHQLIWRNIASLAQKSVSFDLVTVADVLTGHGLLEEAGGLAYLASLESATPSAANIRVYAQIVREKALLRKLISAGTETVNMAFLPEGRSALDVIDSAEKLIFDVAQLGQSGKKSFASSKDLLKACVEKISELYENPNQVTGIQTFYSDFDDKTAGLQKGDLVIVAGRPSMGKTTFAMNIAENVAVRGKKAVAVFSLEMPGEQLMMRMISSVGRIEANKLRTGQLSQQDWHSLTGAISKLSDAPIFVDETAALSPLELRARARRLKREHDIGLIVIDYLQLMRGNTPNTNRTEEISEISRSLKALAKELEVPVIALSQLNRSLEQRPDKRPKMSDLRESGAIEQDADIILFIYRDEVYHPDTEQKGVAEVIIGKQRNGPIGKVLLTFMGEFTRFENFAQGSGWVDE
ncbi:MAG: replicative DNA helicase [Proteobacteria bacterium]|nr:replicative DNA helicase [Pseudomonadota bacterium]